ncbi:hypothetical protein AVEN_135367-1 [Araneus ventricosus]|uniref:Kazal-like domain-containing protein n=2 Tax=Araneus ventricosus TaxID=182803 RepID=A0A4Y2URS4_ARAVE|nr:hypothetical protein AVEN_135367-1 [Araneus ventricosus]
MFLSMSVTAAVRRSCSACNVVGIEASIAKSVTGSCDELKCFHGAKCKEKHGEVQCVCDFKCTSDERDTKVPDDTTVCGTDGNSYGSECQLRQFSCRYQKPIEKAHEGSCSRVNVTASSVPLTTTMSSVRRSTETTTRKPTTAAETKIVREITDEPLENLLKTPKSALDFSTPASAPLKPGVFVRKQFELDSPNLGGHLTHHPTHCYNLPLSVRKWVVVGEQTLTPYRAYLLSDLRTSPPLKRRQPPQTAFVAFKEGFLDRPKPPRSMWEG